MPPGPLPGGSNLLYYVKISHAIDVSNVIVSAFLPLDIFVQALRAAARRGPSSS
jgi:hypothetical protein